MAQEIFEFLILEWVVGFGDGSEIKNQKSKIKNVVTVGRRGQRAWR
jgi:hypothetical protein